MERLYYHRKCELIESVYSASGAKLRVIHRPSALSPTTTKTDYVNGYIFTNNSLSMALTDNGYFTLSGTGVPTYHFYLKDHQGNNRVVVSQSGSVEQINHYYPYGVLFAESTNGDVQRFKYNGKELDRKFGLNWYDHGARHNDAAIGRWHSMDPMAEKYYGISPYTYCGGDPVNRIDFLGMDWYSHEDSVEIDGQKYATIKYEYTDYKSQKELDDNGISGTYLGNILVVFNGHYDERLDNGRIIGEKAVNAEVTVYGHRGAEDISNDIGYTMTSDFSTFGAIANGVYPVAWINKNSKGIPKHYAIINAGPVDCINGVNPSPDWSDPYSQTQKNGIYIHSTATGGRANWGYNKKLGRFWAISTGCLLILQEQWDAFEKQIGHNPFTLILNRQ